MEGESYKTITLSMSQLVIVELAILGRRRGLEKTLQSAPEKSAPFWRERIEELDKVYSVIVKTKWHWPEDHNATCSQAITDLLR